MAEVAQQPPGTGRGGRVGVVVHDDQPVVAHAGPAHGRLEVGGRRAAGAARPRPAGRRGPCPGRRRPRRGCDPPSYSSRPGGPPSRQRTSSSVTGRPSAISAGQLGRRDQHAGHGGRRAGCRGRHARTRGHRAGDSIGMSCSAAVSDPCMPIERGLERLGLRGHYRPGAGARGDHVADAGRDGVADRDAGRAEPAFLDGFLARQHPGPLAEHLPPGGEDVLGGTRPGVHVPGPGLAAEQRHAVAQRRPVGVDVDPVVGPDVHHAVVGRHVHDRAVGQARGDLLGELVDVRELVVPGGRGHAVLVPGRVEVAVVGEHQRRARTRRARRRSARRARRASPPAGTRRRAAPPWSGRCSGRRPGDTCTGVTPAAAARSKIVGRGCQATGSMSPRPAQAVEQPLLAGHRDLVAEHPVHRRRQPGAERAQAGDRGGREARGQRP